MFKKLSLMAIAVAMVAAVYPGGAQSQEGKSYVLDRIKERRVITLGIREASIPFSYLDQSAKPTGYHVELCNRIVDEIRKTLQMPDLQVKHVPVTPQTRVPLIANGTIDMECGSTSNTLTRQQQVDFLAITYIGGTRLAHKKGSGIKEIEDLNGKAIALTVGTTDEKAVQQVIQEKKLNINIVSVKDHPQAWIAVETGRVDAYANDGIMLAGLISRAKNPEQFEVTGRLLSYDPYGIMVPRNDSTFRLIGNRVLADMMRSGELEAIYNKWYNSKLTNMWVPISDKLKMAFEIQALPQ